MQTAEGVPSVCQHAWQLSHWIYFCWICSLDPGQQAQMTCCKGLFKTNMKLLSLLRCLKQLETDIWKKKRGNMGFSYPEPLSLIVRFLFCSHQGFDAWICSSVPSSSVLVPSWVSSGHQEVSYIYTSVWECWSENHKGFSLFSLYSLYQVSFVASCGEYPKFFGFWQAQQCTTT